MSLKHERHLWTPSVLIRNHLWIWWAEIAVDHEKAAGRARQRAVEITPQGKGFGEPFMEETKSSMIAVSASAHALDALYGVFREIVGPVSTEQRWSTILETIKHAAYVSGSAGGGRWATEFEWLFDLRDAAVHFEEKTQPAVPHPTGTHTGAENVAYSLESATPAVDLLFEVLKTCMTKPRPALVEWTNGMHAVIEGLEQRRQPSRSGGLTIS